MDQGEYVAVYDAVCELLGEKHTNTPIVPLERVPNYSAKKFIGPVRTKRRIVNRKFLKQYHDDHPSCEVCGQPAMAWPHHLKNVSLGGDDVEENLLSLCWNHHVGNEGFHPLGGKRWYELFMDRLPEEARQKVEKRLRIDESDNI
jgi:hypothetical protein